MMPALLVVDVWAMKNAQSASQPCRVHVLCHSDRVALIGNRAGTEMDPDNDSTPAHISQAACSLCWVLLLSTRVHASIMVVDQSQAALIEPW